MLGKLAICTVAVISTHVVSCSSIESKNATSKHEDLNLQDYLNISNAERDPIQNIAVSIIGRSDSEVKSIQDYIKFHKITPITNNKILVPGDGAIGTFLIERIISDGDVWFHVKESGIEDEAGEYEISAWKLKNGAWSVRQEDNNSKRQARR